MYTDVIKVKQRRDAREAAQLTNLQLTNYLQVNNQDIAKDLLVVGAKFQLHKLKSVLEKELIRIATPHNCVPLLNVAITSNVSCIKKDRHRQLY